MNTGIAMRSKGFGIIVEISPRLPTGLSHILAGLATAWWPFSAHRLVLNVGTFPLLKKSALTLIVTKPNYYTKVEKSFRAMNVYLSPHVAHIGGFLRRQHCIALILLLG